MQRHGAGWHLWSCTARKGWCVRGGRGEAMAPSIENPDVWVVRKPQVWVKFSGYHFRLAKAWHLGFKNDITSCHPYAIIYIYIWFNSPHIIMWFHNISYGNPSCHSTKPKWLEVPASRSNALERLFCGRQGIPRQDWNTIWIWICHMNSYVLGLAGIYIYIYIIKLFGESLHLLLGVED